MTAVRVDLIHRDERASLGLAVLDRMPVAFLDDQDRPHWFDLTKHLPPRLSLQEAGALIRRLR